MSKGRYYNVDRINKEYLCGKCNDFIIHFGKKNSGTWKCVSCDTIYTTESLEEKGCKLRRNG